MDPALMAGTSCSGRCIDACSLPSGPQLCAEMKYDMMCAVRGPLILPVPLHHVLKLIRRALAKLVPATQSHGRSTCEMSCCGWVVVIKAPDS
jgi:hypothetical protein